MTTPLKELGENAIIESILPYLTRNDQLIVGAGDDCAVVKHNDDYDLLLKTDCEVESLHFTPQTSAELVGRKALARTLSDIAAMGGKPTHALITLFAHEDTPMNRISELYQGLNHLAAIHQVSLAGGETSGLPSPGLIINVMMTGIVPKGSAVLRSTAKADDLIAVTGRLGGSFLSGRHLSFEPRLNEGFLLRQFGIATAMMDLSDGIGTDLPRLAKASGLGFRLDAQSLPLHENCTEKQGLSDGEDYELLFTLSPEKAALLKQIQSEHFPNTPVTIIGEMTASQEQNSNIAGWQHFKS